MVGLARAANGGNAIASCRNVVGPAPRCGRGQDAAGERRTYGTVTGVRCKGKHRLGASGRVRALPAPALPTVRAYGFLLHGWWPGARGAGKIAENLQKTGETGRSTGEKLFGVVAGVARCPGTTGETRGRRGRRLTFHEHRGPTAGVIAAIWAVQHWSADTDAGKRAPYAHRENYCNTIMVGQPCFVYLRFR